MASLLRQASEDVSLANARPGVSVVQNVTEQLERAAWRIIAERWNDVVVRFWIFKTYRYRDLRALWIKLFGNPPADVVSAIGGA